MSEITAINDHQFLVDERDGNGLGGGPGNGTAVAKDLYSIDLTGATDISNIASLPKDLTGIATPVKKTLALDVVAALNANGITSDKIPSKLEGLTFRQDVVVNGQTLHTVYLANDNDFLATDPDTGFDNPNQWYVFGFTDAQLGGTYVPQNLAAVP